MEIQNPKMVAIVGRPNVGKSALFNRLAGKNIAIVHDRPGVTRDRLVATCRRGVVPFDIMDTGGIGATIEDEFAAQVQAEANLAMEEADLILFVVDGVEGVTPIDLELSRTLRKSPKPIILVVNKADSDKRRAHGAEFAKLGFNHLVDVSAAHGLRIDELMALTITHLGLQAADGSTERVKPAKYPSRNKSRKADAEPSQDESAEGDEGEAAPAKPQKPLRIAIVGKPNAGKSSLVNAILGEQRTIVSEIAGTTRDAIDIPCTVAGKNYTLVDTAGLRRKAKIQDAVESFSAMQATKTIRRADLCLLMVDCAEGISMQDRKIASLIVEYQKPCIILLNKFDLYHPTGKMKDRTEELLENAGREFFFLRHAPMIPVSAKEKQFLDKVFKAIERVHHGAKNPPGTGVLNRMLQKAIASSPAAVGRSGSSFNLLYATFRKEDEPSAIPVPNIVLFANRADKLQESYLRHLESTIREAWPAEGLPFQWTIRGKEKKADLKSKKKKGR
ncbi:ribosome biogenesis GTPase Der [Verrucomicrobium spinosum]|uniref:ribosome biogenesis GTPase Der n=2 Tax=Verrucomicrobium spinosum TaxID=2736 RepID=UPI00017450D1|nr:ribosome biogenesis GTPase Der [Verrucomicrobium spinosum]